MIRKPIFAANWKMNKGPSETEDFARSFLSKVQNRTFPCDIVIAPPFVSLSKAAEILGNVSSIALAAQNCSQFDSGAYTGEISAMMLKEFFVHYVIPAIANAVRSTARRMRSSMPRSARPVS